MRSATLSGWWYGRLVTPVPSMIRLVRCEATPMKTAGSVIVSHPPLWCSPIQASS
jgi:hypothetical protein